MSYQSLASSPSLGYHRSSSRSRAGACLCLPRLSTGCLGFTVLLTLIVLFFLRVSAPDPPIDMGAMMEKLRPTAEQVIGAVKNATHGGWEGSLWGWETDPDSEILNQDVTDIVEEQKENIEELEQELGSAVEAVDEEADIIQELESSTGEDDSKPSRPEHAEVLNGDDAWEESASSSSASSSEEIEETELPAPSLAAAEEEFSSEETLPLVELEGDVEEVACSNDAKLSLSAPSFWTVKKLSPTSFAIAPRGQRMVPVSCLRHSLFSVRLLSNAPPFVFALPTPTPTPEFYLIKIDFSTPIPRGTYELDVTLDFSYLEGGANGMVCGDTSQECIIASLKRLGSTSAYLGKTIDWEDEEAKMIKWTQEDVEVIGGNLIESTICSTFSPLVGYWNSHNFYPISSPENHRCNFLLPSLPLQPALTSPIWINFVGDSNSRNLFGHFIPTLGSGQSDSFFTMESLTHNGTVALVAFRSSSGKMEGKTRHHPDIIITWRWWTEAPRHSKQARETAASELVGFVDQDLASFLATVGMPDSLSTYPSLASLGDSMRATRTYISLGSHAESLTTLGAKRDLDFLLNRRYLSKDVLNRNNVRFFTTTFVNPSNIPLDRFPFQDRVRNNAVIEAKNQVLRERKELEGRVVDVEGLTKGITKEWMKDSARQGHAKKLDAVHFVPWVYETWASLVWTELFGDRVRDAEAK